MRLKYAQEHEVRPVALAATNGNKRLNLKSSIESG